MNKLSSLDLSVTMPIFTPSIAIMHSIITLSFICATINLSACIYRTDQVKQIILRPDLIRVPTFRQFEHSSAAVSVRGATRKTVKMEITGENTVKGNVNVENEIKPSGRSAEKEKLVRELTDMGFAKPLVVQVVDNAGDVPKDLIVEQLLNYNPDTGDPIPVVDDDGDELWVDVTPAYKMVIVINMGLKMGIGKIAAQASHATLGLYEAIKDQANLSVDLCAWNEQGCRKIVVEIKNTTELIKVCSVGKLHKIPFFCVQDAGLTEVPPSSFTAVAFFGSDDQLKPVTGRLKLLK